MITVFSRLVFSLTCRVGMFRGAPSFWILDFIQAPFQVGSHHVPSPHKREPETVFWETEHGRREDTMKWLIRFIRPAGTAILPSVLDQLVNKGNRRAPSVLKRRWSGNGEITFLEEADHAGHDEGHLAVGRRDLSHIGQTLRRGHAHTI